MFYVRAEMGGYGKMCDGFVVFVILSLSFPFAGIAPLLHHYHTSYCPFSKFVASDESGRRRGGKTAAYIQQWYHLFASNLERMLVLISPTRASASKSSSTRASPLALPGYTSETGTRGFELRRIPARSSLRGAGFPSRCGDTVMMPVRFVLVDTSR